MVEDELTPEELEPFVPRWFIELKKKIREEREKSSGQA